ncbi:hypothetical protein CTI12_AA472160 [Artemisia annua]|uniref:DUF4216 domain-containing protein n=1 Tax=Artemisia annua TaxID=35608 RepID=A0A2U1LND2_ARTAN|nr:hypothetical protein CTI12_AA472160 [Artemisia annua]
MKKVIWYVLHNSPEIDAYMNEFQSIPRWFESKIGNLYTANDPRCTPHLFALACGPSSTATSINSCVVNGVKFVVHSRDVKCTTQNSGICSPGEKEGEMYYGQLDDILEFSYTRFKVVLFRVKWFDLAKRGDSYKENDNSDCVALQRGHRWESNKTPLRLRLTLVGNLSRRARQEKILTLIGMNFTHLVATSDEGRNRSSIKFLMTLTLNSPSPDKSQVHLSLEDERTTDFRIDERSSHCCRSAPSRTSRRKEVYQCM